VDVLVIDVGGTHVKLWAAGRGDPRRFPSGRDLTPHGLVERVREHARDWPHDVIALGYPGRVGPDGPADEPGNLGDGWVGFDFAAALGKPVRVVNDAALQALGAYRGGRMLFLGLGTGVGPALVVDRTVVPLELGCLPHPAGGTAADRLGRDGRRRDGPDAWLAAVHDFVQPLKTAFAADDVVLGGGHAEDVDPAPPGVRVGGNEDALAGGLRVWRDPVEPPGRPASAAWRLVR
jgi:polyphosphate glucokinase